MRVEKLEGPLVGHLVVIKLTLFVDSQAFFQDLYKGVDDLDGLERRMIRSEESFSKQAAAAFFAERLGR